jgi:hypothetical protein
MTISHYSPLLFTLPNLSNLSIPDYPFQHYHLSSENGFRSSLQPSWPLLIFFPILVEEFHGTRYQSGSNSLINVGSGYHCLRSVSFSFLLQLPQLLWSSPGSTPCVPHQTRHKGKLTKKNYHLRITNLQIQLKACPSKSFSGCLPVHTAPSAPTLQIFQVASILN